mgnify:CR=1 FL=1|jgi:hypothetical protein
MASRSELIEELLWDLDHYYPEHEILEEAWEIFNDEDDLPNALIKKLKRMLKRATGEAA